MLFIFNIHVDNLRFKTSLFFSVKSTDRKVSMLLNIIMLNKKKLNIIIVNYSIIIRKYMFMYSIY